MATIESKFVDVGFFDGNQGKITFPDQYGFGPAAGGTLSNTANGSSDTDISGIYSSTDCVSLVWFNGGGNTTAGVQFQTDGSHSNSGWDSMTVGTTTYDRTDASFSNNNTWFWATTTNPFGTTTGADIAVTWDDGTASQTAPTISSVTNNNASAANVTATVNLSSNGSGGTLKYAQTTSNSVPATGWQTSANFTHPRGATRYYWASQDEDTSGTFDDSGAIAVGYIAPDTNISVSRSPSGNLTSNSTGNVTVTISNGTAENRYRVLRTSPSNLGCGDTGNLSGTSGTVSLDYSVSGELPPAGSTYSYTIQARRDTGNGGDGSYDNTGTNFSIARTDGTPNGYTIPDVPNASLNTEQNKFVQITGITETVTASRTSGTATFAVSSSTTTPSAGSFSGTAKNITNNQYLHVKQTSSGTAGTALNSEFSVGGVTDTFSVTTAAAGDVTVSITYDQESGTFLPAPTITPTVSGQNGLSNAQAYEITAGTDVVFQNVSDPGTLGILVTGLNKFTNNANFTLNQGSSVTRTWATGQTGNSVDSLTLTGASDTDLIYFKQPPTPPDTAVTPVSPANRAFNDTATFNVTVNNVTSGETYKITENNFTTSLGSATASGTSVTIPMTIGNNAGNNYGELSVGSTKTYEIYASRPAGSGGTGLFVATDDTFTVTRNVETVTVPTDIVFTDPGTNDDNVNITVTASGGSGGTLQVSDDNTNWDANGTAYAAIRGTQGTYYARRLGSQSASVSTTRTENYTPPYRAADSNISISGSAVGATVSPGATGNLTLTISNGGSLDQYRVVTTDTNTPLAAGIAVGVRTGNGNVTINSGEQPDAQGTSAGYKVRVRRPTAAGGNNTYVDTGDTFTITRQAISAPTDIAFGADPGTSSATVSITVTASGGANGTIQLSETSNFSSTQANGTSFTFTRGTAKTIYARRVDGSVVSSTYSESNTESYLTPDLSVAGTNNTIAFNAGSATTTVSNVARGTETVAVRVNNGSTNLATRTGNGTLTFSSSLPSVGNTTTYELFTKRAVSTGGDGSTFYATNDTFTVTRSVEPVSAPTDIAFGADPGTSSATVSITCTASGGSGGTLQVSQDNVNWSSNGTSFTFTRGTAKTIYARRAGQGSTSSSYSEAHTVGYIGVDAKVDLSPTSVALAYDANSDITITLTNGTPGNQYQLRLGNANLSTLLLAGSDTSGTLTIGTAVHPTVNNTSTFTLYGRRTTASGGNNTYALTGDSVVVTRNSESLSAPEDITFGADPGTFSQTVSISATASLGSGGTLKVSDDANNWDTNGTSYTFTRGTAKTIYARREGVGANSANYSEEHTVNKLATDTSITVSPTSATVAPNANTTVTINISNATQQHTYHVYKQTGTNTYQGINVNTGTLSGSTGSVTIPNSQLPSAGNSITYRFYGILPISSGGLGIQQITNGTFTISRTAEDVTPNAFTFTDVSNVSRSTTQTSNTITVAGLSTGTSVVVSIIGGTYSKNSGSYTSSTGTASNGDTFSVRHTSSSGFLTNTDTQLTIGGISDTFRSTTLAQDTTPNNYTFNDATDAGVSTLVPSNVQTITGITGNVSVSVSGQGTPKISINGGTFISSGTIQNNQTLQVRLTSSASNSTSHTATVTLGTGTYAQETFVVTTVAASGGTGGGVGAGSSDYGVEVYDTDGTTKVLSPATRYAVRVTDVTTFSFTGTGTANDSVLLQTNMTDLSASNSDVLFLPGSLVLTVTRESNGFRVTNFSSASFTRTMFGIRF